MASLPHGDVLIAGGDDGGGGPIGTVSSAEVFDPSPRVSCLPSVTAACPPGVSGWPARC
jgi:hypothetical protein